MTNVRDQILQIQDLFGDSVDSLPLPEQILVKQAIVRGYGRARRHLSHETCLVAFKYLAWWFSWVQIPLLSPLNRVPLIGPVLSHLLRGVSLLLTAPPWHLAYALTRLFKQTP